MEREPRATLKLPVPTCSQVNPYLSQQQEEMFVFFFPQVLHRATFVGKGLSNSETASGATRAVYVPRSAPLVRLMCKAH